MKTIHVYVISVCIAGVVLGIQAPWVDLPWGADTQSGEPVAVSFGVLMALGLLAERLTVATSVGRATGGTHSVVLIPLFASALLFGGAGPVAFIAISGTVGEFFFRRKGLLRGAFNVGQYVLSSAIAGLVYHALGGRATILGPAASAPTLGEVLVPFAASALTLMALNQTLVAGAISISERVSFSTVWRRVVGKAGANIFYDVLISPIAIVIALLGIELGWVGIVVAILPLLAIRQAYLLTFRIQEANRDLLRALVKAIETRDPYTSGHSRRVQLLSTRIAESMGLPEVKVENITQAALLHDVGKIELVYDEILKKPDDLSAEERRIIESHVDKGVELLRSLSSFPKEVIEAVAAHHEREDGRGYPNKLTGSRIPLGAKIIAVSDAVDAMLSDRPYRKGLPVDVVRRELQMNSGSQFDPSVVGHATSGTMLEDHLTQIREGRATDTQRIAVTASIGSTEPIKSVGQVSQTQV